MKHDPEHVAPTAPKTCRTFCLDIDGVLCTNTWGAYEQAEPLPDAIEKVNRLHKAGHRILLHTARGTVTGVDWRELTERQLADWGVPYDELWMGKPSADLYIDDRAINAVDWLCETHPQREAE